jgi:hypothetical protein
MLLLLALTLVHGTVRIGPTMPVCRQGVPCDKPAAHVRLTFTRPARVRQVTTDALGRYHLRLTPGVWTVRANAGMRTTPIRILVPHALTWRRNLSIDTGIR